MWLVNILVLASGMACSLLQNPASSEQNSSSQQPASSVAKQVSPGPEASVVAPAQPVITIRGLCGESARAGGERAGPCSKVISRKDFESLMDALNPGGQPVSPTGRQNLAQAYVEALTFAEAAKNAGMEDTPQFREVMAWVRLRAIADLYRRNLQEKYRTPSPEEIDTYYAEHLASFERVKLARILVPRDDISVQDKTAFDQKALASATSARQRALKGEETAQIQKDVYATLGLSAPPATELGNYRRADFLEKESAEVFALQPGEVSQVEMGPKSYVVYKVLAKETLPESQVKAEITRDISQQKFRDAIQAVTGSTHPEFNKQYFGPGMAAKSPAAQPVLPMRPTAH
jgi:hypothetical protein